MQAQMKIVKPHFEKYIFVCENESSDGACCAPGGIAIRQRLKDKISALGLADRIRVSRSGCLDVCSEGPNVLVMPDSVWFQRVHECDIEAIIQKCTQ